MKKLLLISLIFVIGLATGIILTSYLAKYASLSFLDIVRLKYQTEQQIMAIRAKKMGKIDHAVVHYRNLVAVSSSPGLYCFNKELEYWTLSFPFSYPTLKPGNILADKRSTMYSEGINRAMLADVLDEAGEKEEARSQYLEAARLLGCDGDVAKVKKIIKGVLSSDDALLELEAEYTYPLNEKIGTSITK